MDKVRPEIDLWGAGLFSYSSVLLSGVGGFAGLWLGYKMSLRPNVKFEH